MLAEASINFYLVLICFYSCFFIVELAFKVNTGALGKIDLRAPINSSL